MNIRLSGAAWQAPAPGTGKLIALERAELLCIQNGRGLRVRALSGVLWITEADSSADRVLSPGDGMDLARAGTTLVSATRAARFFIEVTAGRACPDSVEKVLANGQRTRIALGRPMRGAAASLAGAIATAIANALAPIDAILKRLGARRYSPMTYPDAYAPRQRRPRAKHATHSVERAVIDQWLIWRG